MGDIFSDIVVGTEAVAEGVVTRHDLQRWYRPIYPNVHARRDRDLSLRDRTIGAWLWARRTGVVTGVAASALHGAEWVDTDRPIELISERTHPPRGVITRNERLAPDEITCIAGIPTTTRARTALDLGRFQPEMQAIARLDALMRAAPFSVDDVECLALRYRGARGVAQLRKALSHVDGGAASPRETRLRMLFINAGLPRPETQIVVLDEWGSYVRRLDMGWPDYQVAAEYDGDQHQTNRVQYIKDHRVMRKLKELGWDVHQVIKEDSDREIVRRAEAALRARGWVPSAEMAFQQAKFEKRPAGMPFRRMSG